jgi:L-iditol 2-dehydrogenase
MKVLRLHADRELRLHEEDTPQPGVAEVLLRVMAVGICGSDLLWLSTGAIGEARIEQPLVLGHEFSGVVESGARRGERVAVDPAVNCGICEACKRGNPNLCADILFAGHASTDGALREFMVWPEHLLHRLPATLSFAEGAALEPLCVAIHAVDLGHVKLGMSIGVFGCGPIGLLIIQLAQLLGVTGIVATDVLDHRLEAAQRYGATAVIQARNGEEYLGVLEKTNGRGVDVSFEAAGENAAVEAAIGSARSGGRVVLIGIPEEDRTSFCASRARRKGLTLAFVRRMKHAYQRALDLAQTGRVDLQSLTSHHYPLRDFETAFDAAKRRLGLKVLIEL